MVSKSVALGKRQLSDELKFRHGQLAYPARARRVRGFRNLDGGAAQVETITVDTYSDGDNLVVVFTSDDGEITVTYTMTTADTNAAGAASSLAAFDIFAAAYPYSLQRALRIFGATGLRAMLGGVRGKPRAPGGAGKPRELGAPQPAVQ